MIPSPSQPSSGPRAVAVLLRPAQWTKNLVVLAPLVFAGLLTDPPSAVLALQMAVAFGLLASAGYVWNDLLDRRADRAHPDKRHRPLASGALGTKAAVLAALLCTAAGLALGRQLQLRAPPLHAAAFGPLAWLLAYLVLGALYSLLFKRIAGLDVVVLAAGLVTRAGAGSAALQLRPSPWLLVCTFGFGLFLALLKRRAESFALDQRMQLTRPMSPAWPPALLARALDAAAVAAVLCWLGYALWSETAAVLGRPALLLLSPLVAYGVLRARRLARTPAAGDPVTLLLRDGRALGAFLLWLAALLALLYRP